MYVSYAFYPKLCLFIDMTIDSEFFPTLTEISADFPDSWQPFLDVFV